MKNTENTPLARTTSTTFGEYSIVEWANQFYQAKKAERVSGNTLTFYKQQLGHFFKFCDSQVITNPNELSPTLIRLYILWLEEQGHNPGGQHAAYRVLKTFLRWYENEAEPENWKNPINKVKPPKIAEDPLQPVELSQVEAMVRTCRGNTFLDKRDKAILLCLLDTGARAREFLAFTLNDVDLISGAVLIPNGKGRKPRNVFLGKHARQVLRSYLKVRKDRSKVVWVTDDQKEQLSYSGLRAIINRRSKLAGIERPTLHDFRRAFAINMHRAGVDLESIALMMGHTSTKVLRRYLKLTQEDLQAAHSKGSPADKIK